MSLRDPRKPEKKVQRSLGESGRWGRLKKKKHSGWRGEAYRSLGESGHFLHICGSDDGIIVRIDFWQIEAESRSYAVASIPKNRGKHAKWVSWEWLLS